MAASVSRTVSPSDIDDPLKSRTRLLRRSENDIVSNGTWRGVGRLTQGPDGRTNAARLIAREDHLRTWACRPLDTEEDHANKPEVQNPRAVVVVTRVSNKLTGAHNADGRLRRVLFLFLPLTERPCLRGGRAAVRRSGRDFKQNEVLDVPSQVERLIQQATSVENLCQCYVGWYVACLVWAYPRRTLPPA